MSKQTRQLKAFTLIELLVVIAIIGLLLAVITPSLQKAKEYARLVICSSNQHQLVIGVIAYTTAWDGLLPPPVARGGRPCVLNRRQSNTAAYPSLGDYLPLAEVYNCPVSSFSGGSMVNTPGGQYSYQHLYENPRDDFNLNASNLLLWNYNGFDSDKSQKKFKGPGRDSDNKLLFCDVFMYSNNLQGGGILQDHWVSTHSFKEGGFKKKTSEFPYFFLEGPEGDFDVNPALQNVKLNAGYMDGRVDRYLSGNSYRMQAVAGYASMYIPRIWK